MATTSNASREARRRRIVERGSDRLALITGRIDTIPSPPSPLPADSPEPPTSPGQYRHPLLAKQPGVRYQAEDKASRLLLKHNLSGDGPEIVLPNHDFNNDKAPDLGFLSEKVETCKEAIVSPSVQIGSESEISPSSAVNQGVSLTTSGAEQPSDPQRNLLRSINPSKISSAIASSEKLRLFCSIIGGLLAVSSYLGFTLLGNKIFSSILMFRPLYLVLLTNVTIVLAQLISKKQLSSERPARVENANPLNDGDDWVAQVGTTLELGFLMMNIMDAVTMDCSLYAVVVVCGTSLAQMFF